ncbi:MAG: RNase adapter RapZ [Polyangiaceae bacterium]|nr:RNase adapter RapZ [Polyangiaceae bacterium]
MTVAQQNLDLVIVTGMSGAGKTTVLNALEDSGFYCIDNLPPPVVEATLSALHKGGVDKVALGLDIRVRAYLEKVASVIDALVQKERIQLRVLYLESSEKLLAQRFSATRRPHPLSTENTGSSHALLDGIVEEHRLLIPLRERADIILDTTALNVHQLRREATQLLEPGESSAMKTRVRVLSFGFKFGIPYDVDLLFDVRFLPNPYFSPDLRPLSGLDREVADYVLGLSDAQELLEHLEKFLRFCLPRYKKEGKSYVTVGIGCTGGRHRSVALAEELTKRLNSGGPDHVQAAHRDIRQSEHSSDGTGESSPELRDQRK